MPKRILLVAALAAFPAAAEARDVVQPSTITRSATVAGGDARTLALSCRAPAIALNATPTGLPTGAALRRSWPAAGVLSWNLELAAAESAARQKLSASVRCLRLELPAGVTDVSLAAETRRAPGLAVPAGSTRSASVRCERGYIPTGYGLDRGAADVQVAKALAGTRGWSFRLANSGTGAADVSLSIRCTRARVEGLRRGAPVSLKLETNRVSFTDDLSAGRALRHSCPAGEFSIATGVSLDPAGGLALESAQPTKSRGGLWTFRGSRGRVTTQLLCLTRNSTFR